MSVNINELKKQIQDLRAILKKLAVDRELTDPEVLGESKKLDEMLLEYENLLIKNQKL